MTLFIRLFVEVSPDEAATVAERLRKSLEGVAVHARTVAVRSYWKIPRYQELQLDIECVGEAKQAVTSVTSHLGTGWARHGAREAIWNQGPNAFFVESVVRWAQVEAVE